MLFIFPKSVDNSQNPKQNVFITPLYWLLLRSNKETKRFIPGLHDIQHMKML